MSSHDLSPAELAAVVDVLQTCAGPIETTASHAWRLTRPGESAADISAAVNGAWLHLETSLTGRGEVRLPGPRRAHRLLQGNTFLPQGMSYCVGRRSQGTYLVADAPLHDCYAGTDQMLRDVQELCNAFCSVCSTTPGKWAAADARAMDGLHQPLTVDDEAGESIRALCDSTGWEYHERGNGQLVITLDVPGQFCQAHVYLLGETEYRVGTILESRSEVSPLSRHAMASFLLTASRVVRMARAAVVSDNVASEYRWEVAWPHLPTPTQFHCGLSALAMACRLTRQELLALCDKSIASLYLKLRGSTAQ